MIKILISVSFFYSVGSFAEVEFSARMFASRTSNGDKEATASELIYFVNPMVGVGLKNGFAARGGYYYQSWNVGNSINSEKENKTLGALNLGAGYQSSEKGGLVLFVDGYLFPTKTHTVKNVEVTYFGGSGYGAEAGWLFSAGDIVIGPTLFYQQTTFKKSSNDDGALELPSELNESWVSPSLMIRYSL